MNKQLSIFSHHDEQAEQPNQWELFTDGAARFNPGPAGAGIHLLKNGQTVEELGFYLGHKTNNQAEYLALLLGLYYATKHMAPHDKLTVISDSELLIKQLKGVYRVKDDTLKQLFACAQGYMAHIHTTYLHVLREKNKIADKMANTGIDKKIAPPEEFLSFCKTYGISQLV